MWRSNSFSTDISVSLVIKNTERDYANNTAKVYIYGKSYRRRVHIITLRNSYPLKKVLELHVVSKYMYFEFKHFFRGNPPRAINDYYYKEPH